MIDEHPTLVIAGSVRPNRLAVQIATWIAAIGRETKGSAFEVVDLTEWPLPMDDEPDMPQTGRYEFEHTRAWSRKIAAARAFVFVTPQYNGGYPAALKNAIDHVYAEWAGKPAMIVTYGGHGGSHCAEQLTVVCRFTHMKPIVMGAALTLSRERIEADSGTIEPAIEFADHLPELQQKFVEFAAASSDDCADTLK